MQGRYRKKETIKAEKFDGTVDMMRQYNIRASLTGHYYKLATRNGSLKLEAGDWIVINRKGEREVIPASEFEKNYEKV